MSGGISAIYLDQPSFIERQACGLGLTSTIFTLYVIYSHNAQRFLFTYTPTLPPPVGHLEHGEITFTIRTASSRHSVPNEGDEGCRGQSQGGVPRGHRVARGNPSQTGGNTSVNPSSLHNRFGK